jgi:hypothetical protein
MIDYNNYANYPPLTTPVPLEKGGAKNNKYVFIRYFLYIFSKGICVAKSG